MTMVEFILAVICSSIITLGYGSFFYFFIFNNKIFSEKNYYEISIFGIVFISFLAVIINFFIPINTRYSAPSVPIFNRHFLN